MKKVKTIFDMNVGEKGIIIDLKDIDQKARHRFMDIGIASYAKIELLRKVNINRLYVIEVDDVEICIRQIDAKKILVEVE